MATVTGLTAARMQAIENASIVSGSISGDDLILTNYGGGNINAGNVRGPQGIQGPPGQAFDPGTLIFGLWSSDPSDALILDGRTIVGGAATYPTLAALVPGWVSGGNLILPNADGALLRGAATNIGQLIGSDNIQISASNLPAHDHSLQGHTHGPGTFSTDIDHDHGSFTTAAGGNHWHQLQGFNLDTLGATGSTKSILSDDGYAAQGYQSVYTTATTHQHTIDVPNYNVSNRATVGLSDGPSTNVTGSTGSGTAITHTPRSLACRVAVIY